MDAHACYDSALLSLDKVYANKYIWDHGHVGKE